MGDAVSPPMVHPIGPKSSGKRSTDWGGKALLVFLLAVLMAIPGLFVWALIAERSGRADQAVSEVSALQGGRSSCWARSSPCPTPCRPTGTGNVPRRAIT